MRMQVLRLATLAQDERFASAIGPVYLTFVRASMDTAFNAELKERRNCGHGYVYARGTHPCGS